MMRRWFIGFLAAGMLLALAGCSHPAMKATPLWDQEYHKAVGPPENRINLWPLFYYRNPAISILWPFIAITDEGHAVIPFYEFQNKEKELRIGTIHQWIPALAVSNGEKDYFRILNVARDGKAKSFTIFPLYFRNWKDNWWLVFPLFYHDKDGFWSPVVTWFPRVKGFLGPLFFRHENRETDEPIRWYFPFPILGFWHRGENGGVAFPLVYWNRYGPNTTVNVGILLFDLRRKGENTFIHYLIPFGGYSRKGKNTWNYLVPLWYSQNVDGESTFVSLPYIRFVREHSAFTNLLLLGYTSIQKDGKRYETFLFPIFHRFSTPKESGYAVAPLFLWKRSVEGVRTFLSPLVSFRSDGSLLNVAGPLFHYSRAGAERFLSVLWPIFVHKSDETGTRHWTFPFYYWHRKPNGVGIFYSLLASFRTDGRLLNFLGPLYYSDSEPGKSFRSVLFPFWMKRQKSDSGWNLLAPLYLRTWSSTAKRFFSLPLSFGESTEADSPSHWVNVALLLAHWESNPQETTLRLFLPLIKFSVPHGGGVDHYIFPLYKYKSDKRHWHFSTLLGIPYFGERYSTPDNELKSELRDEFRKVMTAWDDSPKAVSDFHATSDTTYLYPDHLPRFRGEKVQYDHTFLLGIGSFESKVKLTRRVLQKGKSLRPGEEELVHKNGLREADALRIESRGYLFPLFYYERKENRASRFDLLWRLYDSERLVQDDGSVYTRQRVLWRIYHRETLGDKVAVDVFPFITWDHGKDKRKFSFAGGFFGFGHEGNKHHVNLFWIPIRW